MNPSLAYICSRRGDTPGAIASYREALRVDPRDFGLWRDLSEVLRKNGELDEALAAAQKAVLGTPGEPFAHVQAGESYKALREYAKAAESYVEVVRLLPANAYFRVELGLILQDKGDFAEAIAAHREAVRLDPKYARAHYGLGCSLHRIGDLNGAIVALKEAIRLSPTDKNSRQRLQEAERHAVLLNRLPAVLERTDSPHTAEESLEFADLCQQPFQKRFAAAVRLAEQAFAADPKLAANLVAGFRYNAACAAALSGTGLGVDAPADGKERGALRAKAVGWLRDDLEHHKTLARSPHAADRKSASHALKHWIEDTHLSGLKPGLLRVGIPLTERQELDKFWAEVKGVLAEANKPLQREVLPPPRAEK